MTLINKLREMSEKNYIDSLDKVCKISDVISSHRVRSHLWVMQESIKEDIEKLRGIIERTDS